MRRHASKNVSISRSRQSRSCRLALEQLESRVTPTALPAGFTESLLAGGLSAPTAMAFAPDGRLFVAQQGGELRVIKNGQLLSTSFVSLSVDSAGERGLLGVAFDPNFATNHYVYVYYTVPTSPEHNRVSRFTANGDVAVPGSEVPILNLDNLSSATNHNGGAVHFGLDGKLYIGVGDNANGANAQSLTTLLGKLLRINPDGTIPTDNPFYTQTTGVDRAIWALGLRNPFTFAVQPGTGQIFINDVGENTWEEIDKGIAGGNYGWPATEGPTSNPAYVSPIFAYGHGSGDQRGIAITGGTFYNPATANFPNAYVGNYFYEDLGNGWIRLLNTSTNTTSLFATNVASQPVDLEVGPDGALYYLAHGAGGVYRISYSPPRVAAASLPSGALETFAVSTTQGLYKHDDASGWTQIGAAGTVLSVAAVANSGGPVAFVMTTDHALDRYSAASGWTKIGASGTIDAISAGTDVTGQPEVFVIATDAAFYSYDAASGWSRLGAARSIQSMSAAGRGRVVVVTLDNAVSEYDPHTGWLALSGSDFAQSAAAVTDASGNLVAYAVTVAGNLDRDMNNTGWQSAGNSTPIASVSAGTDRSGQANAFAIAVGGALYSFSSTSTTPTQLANAGTVQAVSALDQDRLLAVYTNEALYEHDDTFGWFPLTSSGFVHL
jgi:glucose/arabinose dehydrogenase